MINNFKKCLAMALMCFLSGCSLVPKSDIPALTVYRLPEMAVAQTVTSGNDTQLVVPEPAVGLSLDGRRVMVLDARGQMQVLPGVIWADRPAAMLQSMLISVLAGSGQFSVVAPAGAAIRGDARLISRLLDFEIELAPSAQARVHVALSLVTSGGHVLCHTRVDIRQPVAGKEVAKMVTALREAATQAVERSRDWLAARGCQERSDP